MSDRLVIGAARWAAMREMREAYGVPLRLMAEAVGVAAGTVGSHARRQKWSAPAGRAAGHANRRGLQRADADAAPKGADVALASDAPAKGADVALAADAAPKGAAVALDADVAPKGADAAKDPDVACNRADAALGADGASNGADDALDADGASNGADAALGQHAASFGADDALDGGAGGLADGSAEALSAFARGQLRALLRDAKSGRIDKAQVDAVWSVFRMVEKAETLAEGARQIQQKRSDDELAAIFDRINARIVELAGELAERRSGQQPDGRAG